jgi:hypothetical protein
MIIRVLATVAFALIPTHTLFSVSVGAADLLLAPYQVGSADAT